MKYGKFDVMTIDAETGTIDHNYCDNLEEAIDLENYYCTYLPLGSTITIYPLDWQAQEELSFYLGSQPPVC